MKGEKERQLLAEQNVVNLDDGNLNGHRASVSPPSPLLPHSSPSDVPGLPTTSDDSHGSLHVENGGGDVMLAPLSSAGMDIKAMRRASRVIM